jgi:hypothetical protein
MFFWDSSFIYRGDVLRKWSLILVIFIPDLLNINLLITLILLTI